MFLQKLIYDGTLIAIHHRNVFNDVDILFAIIIAKRKTDCSVYEAVKSGHLTATRMKRAVMDGGARSCRFPV